MYRMVASYHHPENPEAFLEHYRTSHAVKSARIPGLRHYAWGVTDPGADGSQPPYFLVAVMDYDSAEALGEGLATPEGQVAVADMEEMPHNGVTITSFEFEPTV